MASIIKTSGDADGAAIYRDAAPFAFGELPAGADAAPGAAAECPAAAHPEKERGPCAAPADVESAVEERVRDRLATLGPALDEVVCQIEAAKAQWLAHWEQAALQVAMAIARRVIRREIDRAPDITLSLVREALELAAGSGEVQLRLHPRDFDALGQHVKRLAKDLSRLGRVDVVADPTIGQGGCRVDTRFGTIDQQLEAQLRRIEQELS